jgi:hypothetical protein
VPVAPPPTLASPRPSLPQAFLNCRRRSTEGWSLLNIGLDLLGGALSLGQQLAACRLAGSWEPVAGNPVKLGLAAVTIAFDCVFLAQHAAYYAPSRRLSAPGAAAAAARVRSVLRALAAAPEALPFDVAEDALLTLGEAGVDVHIAKELERYAEHPESLPTAALDRLLGAYWAGGVGVAVAVAGAGAPASAPARPGGAWVAAAGGLRAPLLGGGAAGALEGIESASSSESGSYRDSPIVDILLRPAAAAAAAPACAAPGGLQPPPCVWQQHAARPQPQQPLPGAAWRLAGAPPGGARW